MDGNTIKQLNKQEIDNINDVSLNVPMKSTEELEEGKERQGRKLKLFQIFKFADKWDILCMIVGTILGLATGVAMLITMWLFQSALNGLVDIGNGNVTISTNCYTNSLSSDDPFTTIKGIFKWYIGLGVLSFCLYLMAYAFWMKASERQLRRIGYTLFASIIRQEIGWFDCQNIGELSNRLLGDLENIRKGIGFYVADSICLSSDIIGLILFAFYAGWKLSIGFLVFSSLIIVLIRFTEQYTESESQAYSKANSIAREILGAIRTVTAFGGQKKEVERYEKNLAEGRRLRIKRGIQFGLIQAIVSIALYGSAAFVFWFGPYLIRNECQNYSAGHWIVIFISCFTATFLIVDLIQNIQLFIAALNSANYIFQIIERSSKIDIFDNQGEIPVEFIGNIEFKNVYFTYPSRKEALILNGLNMKIPSGTTIALYGSSGSGKSTSIQLIQRFYDPDQGVILLDGRDIRSINLKWLRSNISIVSQEPVLFFGTIEDNIRFGKPDATDEEVIAAAKMANAHDFIMQLPQKYKTSSRGKLSGGQKQRIAIARALISNPKILLLDEATSALDNQSEKIVQDALDKAKKGRTTIVIAHRLSTIKNADIIVGLDRGRVIECGTHDELMQQKGFYYELVMVQSEKEEDINSDKEEELIQETNESTKDKKWSRFRRMRKMFRHSSVDSDEASIISEDSLETENDLQTTNHVEKQSRFQMPFILQIAQLNYSIWLHLLFGGIASLTYGIVVTGLPFFLSNGFGVLAETDLQKQNDQIRTYTWLIFLIGVISAICQIISSATLTKAREELIMRMKVLYLKSMLRQEIGWFDLDENNLDVLVKRLSSDAIALKGLIDSTFGGICNAIGALSVALFISFINGWKLTLVIFCLTSLMVLAGLIKDQQFFKSVGKKKASTSDSEEGGKYIIEAIENIRTVVSFHQEENFVRSYKRAFDDDFGSHMFDLLFISIAKSLNKSLRYFIYAAAFGYGVTLLGSGEMEFQNVLLVYNVIICAGWTIEHSLPMIPSYSKIQESAKRILELSKRRSNIDPDNSSGIILPDINGDIEFRDVKFRYPARPKLRILRNLNLQCPSGQTTALVGASGNGKSTTIALIQRFYDPLAGTILLDGNEIKTLNIQWLRSLIGLVEQEPILFNLSIRENIAYGDNNRQVTQDEIETAARKANIHDLIISLPEGYNTLCGVKGSQLSGGQKQRIAIARALIRKPKILLLDEATSALDNQSEKIVQDALDKAKEGRTCLTIAHRLSTIRKSEKICVVKCGQIKESGPHEQLLEQHGSYYKLYMAQEYID